MSVVVYGSLNADTALEVPHFAQPGETLSSTAMHTGAGGKGFNQAVAAVRMHAPTVMVGAIGTDSAAQFLAEALTREGLDPGCVRVIDGDTGQAFITIDAAGENTIIIVPGANGQHTQHTATTDLDFLTSDNVLVCQLEIPADAVQAGLTLARTRGATTVLNAAPAAPVAHLLKWVDVLVINETEAAVVASEFGCDPSASALFEATACEIVLTLGSQGVDYAGRKQQGSVPAFPVNVVDTTGAGDAFVGALATQLHHGLAAACRFAAALGALACEGVGAQGYPARLGEVNALLSAE